MGGAESSRPDQRKSGRAIREAARRSLLQLLPRRRSASPSLAHHAEVMQAVSGMEHCGSRRTLKAFIYRDWYSLRSRYLHELRQLRGSSAQQSVRAG